MVSSFSKKATTLYTDVLNWALLKKSNRFVSHSGWLQISDKRRSIRESNFVSFLILWHNNIKFSKLKTIYWKEKKIISMSSTMDKSRQKWKLHRESYSLQRDEDPFLHQYPKQELYRRKSYMDNIVNVKVKIYLPD